MTTIKPKTVEQQRRTGWLIIGVALAVIILESAGVPLAEFAVDFLKG